MARSVWLLDVDGVVNVTRPGGAWGAGAPRRRHVWRPSWCDAQRVRWAGQLVEYIRLAHWSGRVEVRWCTSWCPDAQTLEELWHLPTLVRALGDYPIDDHRLSQAKLAAARAVLAANQRLVWTDDQAIPGPGTALGELLYRGDALLIAPNPRCGLQPYHVADINAFLRDSTHPGGYIGPEPRRQPETRVTCSQP